MNIEIANRLFQLRKKSGLSQEELAEKLGISRQSVSKWERAEASPDTDNLILLAKLYGVTLDELLMGGAFEADTQGAEGSCEEGDAKTASDEQDGFHCSWDGDNDDGDGKSHVHIGPGGIHIDDGEDKVHISWKGIHIEENGKESVHVGKDGVRVNGDEVKKDEHGDYVFFDHEHDKKLSAWNIVPVPVLCLIAFLLLGILCNAWSSAWIVFLLVPIYYSFVDAIRKRNPNNFAYPIFVAALYLIAGMVFGRWHPEWVIFLTVPVYYAIADACYKASGAKHKTRDGVHVHIGDDDNVYVHFGEKGGSARCVNEDSADGDD